MSAVSSRVLSVLVGVATFVAAGLVLGGGWWAAAGVSAGSVLAAAFDRRMGYPVVVATLALCAGAASQGHDWLVVVAVAGVVASFEFAAAADRATVVRPRPATWAGTLTSTVLAAAGTAAVVLVGSVDPSLGAWSVLAAAGAAVVALRVLVR